MKKYIFSILISLLFLASCGEYQKLLKSTDAELKYDKAVEYYQNKSYSKAITLFDDVTPYFRGTDRSELILNFLANSYLQQKDYYSASEYFKTYIKSYPRGKFTAEAKYMIAYCYYLDSQDVRLDQTTTYQAINAFQDYIDIYPESERVKDATKLLDELNDKLAHKYYINSKLYYNLGTYLGNNYKSAVITAENALKKFPATKYREDLMILILQSKYQESLLSFEEIKSERFQSTIDEYYNYINEFPEGKFRKEADKMLKVAEKNTKE